MRNGFPLKISILNWSAWAPGLTKKAAWKNWAAGKLEIEKDGEPSVQFLPGMFRRRLSRLSKMSLLVAYDCLLERAPVNTVFCSRHGEIHRTLALLKDIAKGELISPTGFSLSVHNTSSGLFSIANNDVSSTTAIASCIDTFENGFVEAAGILNHKQSEHVLLVISDDSIPSVYKHHMDEHQYAYAVAFLLTDRPSASSFNLTIQPGIKKTIGVREPHALRFLRFMLNGDQQLLLDVSRNAWLWSLNLDSSVDRP